MSMKAIRIPVALVASLVLPRLRPLASSAGGPATRTVATSADPRFPRCRARHQGLRRTGAVGERFGRGLPAAAAASGSKFLVGSAAGRLLLEGAHRLGLGLPARDLDVLRSQPGGPCHDLAAREPVARVRPAENAAAADRPGERHPAGAVGRPRGRGRRVLRGGVRRVVLHLVGDGDEIVAQLAVGDAVFWVVSAADEHEALQPARDRRDDQPDAARRRRPGRRRRRRRFAPARR